MNGLFLIKVLMGLFVHLKTKINSLWNNNQTHLLLKQEWFYWLENSNLILKFNDSK